MADAIEIANAYVALTTKMPHVKKDIEKELGGVDSGGAGKSIGDKLMKGVKVGALAGAAAVGGGIVATLGVALTKGFSRLSGIDNATAKMKGLGFSAEETQGLMDNALTSVRGTAFGLQDAAGVAAQLAATGIGPGKEMAGVLKTVANTAAAAGGGMDEMGSIFAKVASSGKAQNDSLQQLSDRGIPIYQKLGEQMGVTTDEVFKLASDGKISFEQFASAAEAAGGKVAEAMGQTVSGSWDNLQASLGRVGANLLGGAFDNLAPAIQGITSVLGPLEGVAAGAGEAIGAKLAPAMEWVANLAEGDTPAWMQEVAGGFRAMGAAFDAGGSDITSSGLAGFMEGIGLLAREVSNGIRAMFAAFADGGSDITSSGLAGVFEALGLAARMLVETDLFSYLSPISLIFQALQPVLPQILDVFSQLVVMLGGALSEALAAILPFITELLVQIGLLAADVIPMLLPFVGQLAELFMSVLDAILPLMDPLMQLIQAVFPVLAVVIEALMPVIEGIVNALDSLLGPSIDGIVQILDGVITFLTGVFTGDWEMAWDGIVGIFEGIWNSILGIAEGIINAIVDLINGLIGGVNDITEKVGIPEIPLIPHADFSGVMLRDGGIIPSSNGGTLATIGEAGRDEVVIPLPDDWRSNGLSGLGSDGPLVQVDVHSAPGMDEAVIGQTAGASAAYQLSMVG